MKSPYHLFDGFGVELEYMIVDKNTLQVKAIADELLKQFDKIIKVAVRVRKNNPPLGGVVDCVEAEVIKARHD